MKGDMQTIEDLMKILQDKKLTEILYETPEMKITIKGSLIPEEKTEKAKPKKVVDKKVEEKIEINTKDIVSEHIGRYNYLKKDGTPIIEIGQEIKEGQELGAVIAVGVSLPVVAKFSGIIEEIYIKNGEPVDYGRPLLKVKIS